LIEFQEQEIPTDFEYTARNDVTKIFSATQEDEPFEHFKEVVKSHYGLTKKEALKLAFQYGKENGVAMPDSWVKNKHVGNMWLTGMRKHHQSLCLRKPEATSLTQLISFNVKAFLET
jgi:hypothetical protein